jgi:hypothetical protein
VLETLRKLVFSDRGRPYVAALIVGYLVWMGWSYSRVSTARTKEVVACTQSPDECRSDKVFLALTEVRSVGENTITVRKSTVDYVISGVEGPVHESEILSVIATIPDSPDAPFQALSWEHHPLRAWKVRLSLLGLLLAGGVTLASFRIENRRVVERG